VAVTNKNLLNIELQKFVVTTNNCEKKKRYKWMTIMLEHLTRVF